MKNFKVPWQEAEVEYIEKKSRFLGHIYKIQTPEQAQEILAAVRKTYWDASHNVYAYVLQSGVMRFSDDGGSIYILYLYCVIDRLNGEYGRFESDSAIFEAAFARLLAARRGPRPRARLKIWT